jgi:hypothetical protein
MPFKKKSDWTVEEIKILIEEGKSMKEIGDFFGLSRQRIKQICEKHKLPSTVKTRQQIRAEAYFAKWGNKEKTDLYTVCREKFRRKKASAKTKGIDWTVQFGELEWPKECPILGLEIDYFAEERQENSPSFDRIDPSRGYVAGNVRIVSWRANRIKNDGSAKEHRLIAEYLENIFKGG